GKDPSKPQVVLFVNRQNPEVRYYVEIVPNPALYEFYLLESPKEISTNLGKSPEAPQLRMLGRIGVDEMLMSALGWTVGYPALTSHQRLSPQLIAQRIIQVQSGEILVAGQKTGINITQSADGKTQQLRTFVVVTETAGLTARALQDMPTTDIPEPRIIQLRDPNQREVYFLRVPERVEQSFFPQLFTLT
ncbi:MAG: hypothetical protein Q8R11_01915, partial [bacterium]|nr:hypothetical protein [bacterium]